MSDISERKEVKIETVRCPYCNKADINIKNTSGYVSYRVSRISAGSKRTPYIHDPKIEVLDNCPNCGKTKREIKDALEKGKKAMSHSERLKLWKKRGLPLKVKSSFL